MDLLVLNKILALHRFFVHMARRDSPSLPAQRMWLTQIEKQEGGRLLLHVCEPSDPTRQLLLGQAKLGGDVFFIFNEDLAGKMTYSLNDPEWKVTGINLPLPR